jgi:hypothetical protein
VKCRPSIGGRGFELRKANSGRRPSALNGKTTLAGTQTRVSVRPGVVQEPYARQETARARTGRPRRHPRANLGQLKEHPREYGLERNEDKTRPIRFGRFAALNRAERGEGKPEAFTFLGLQHVCGKNRLGRFEVRRIAGGKRRRKKLREPKRELRRRMHAPIAQAGEWLRSALRGYFQYHAVPGNLPVLFRFRRQVARLWFRTPASATNGGPLGGSWLPCSGNGNPGPGFRTPIRMPVSTPDSERSPTQGRNRMRPFLQVRVCAGGGRQRPSLPRRSARLSSPHWV